MTNATAEDFFAKRERKSVDVEIGSEMRTIFYYDPPSVAERDAFIRGVTHTEQGLMFGLDAIVDGIMARVKDENSRPLFKKIHRSRMLEEMSEPQLMAIWRAIGGDSMRSADDLVETAEKK